MMKRNNISLTISMILADKNGYFYQSREHEKPEVDQGKEIREAFFKAGVTAKKLARTFSAFAAASTCVIDEVKKLHDYSEMALSSNRIIKKVK